MIHGLVMLLTGLLASPAWSESMWRVVSDSPSEVVSIDLASLQRSAGRIGFREQRRMRDVQLHPGSRRPVRAILARRVFDCERRRMATLSRAVFSDDDALIEHQAVRLPQAAWHALPRDEPAYRLVCERS
ncbi:MAG: surface-adhesin E family protein [Gammaproteobacteria bacterium]